MAIYKQGVGGTSTNSSRSTSNSNSFSLVPLRVTDIILDEKHPKYNSWSDTYYHTTGHGGIAKSGESLGNFTSVGLRGWWRPDDTGTITPSVSVGYDTTSYDNATEATDSSNAYFVGLNWMDLFQPDDKVGVAFGRPTTNEVTDSVSPMAFEAYYAYKVNDSVTVTPTVFAGWDRNGLEDHNMKGALLETTFKF